MTLTDIVYKFIIPLVAAIIGAVIGAIQAFKYQRRMEVQRDKRALMQVMMAYRTIGAVEIDWVKALNMVDIVFHNDKEVKRLLRSYMYHTDTTRFSTGYHQTVLVELLVEMGKVCGYTEITETDIRDGYNPTSLQHIYAATLARLSQEALPKVDAPLTTPEKNNDKEGEK